MIYQFNRAQNNILLHICKHLLYPRYLPFKGAGAEYTSSNATNFLKKHVNLHILIIIHPHSGWYYIFGHSPNQYWLRTSAPEN